MSLNVSIGAAGQNFLNQLFAGRDRRGEPSQPLSHEPANLEIGNPIDPAKTQDRKIAYQIHQESHEVIIQVIDRETGEVVRQIPEEEFIRLANGIADLNKRFFDITT